MAIYSTLGLAGAWAEELRRRDLLSIAFTLAFLLVVASVLGSAMRRRPGGREAWVSIGILAVYGMVVVRMGLPERTHLFEYGLLAVLLHQALTERRANGGHVGAPALLAIAATAALGWIDEGIQALLPDRVYDLRDVGTNALAALMAVTASSVVAWARRRDDLRRRPKD